MKNHIHPVHLPTLSGQCGAGISSLCRKAGSHPVLTRRARGGTGTGRQMGSGARGGRGFTLVELLVVLVILGMIVGLVGPRVMKHLGTAKSDTTRLQVAELGAALDLFYLEVGRYPTTEEGLGALIQKPSDARNWNGPYLKKNKLPQDPWNNDYRYQASSRDDGYKLYSYGADNQQGGEGQDADINSWE